MKLNTIKSTLVICSSLFLATASMAGFDITRMTTVVDDLSGSYTVSKNGRLDDMQFSGASLTEFNQFHPGSGENEATINGVISKDTSRGNGQLTTTSDGAFTLESKEGLWDVSFSGLLIQASDSGVEMSGTVEVNGEAFDAADLPDNVGKLLRRVFWLTRR